MTRPRRERDNWDMPPKENPKQHRRRRALVRLEGMLAEMGPGKPGWDGDRVRVTAQISTLRLRLGLVADADRA